MPLLGRPGGGFGGCGGSSAGRSRRVGRTYTTSSVLMHNMRRMGRTVHLVSVSAKAAMQDKNLPPIGVLRLEYALGSADDGLEDTRGTPVHLDWSKSLFYFRSVDDSFQI